MSILANKATWLAALLMLCVGLAVGAVFGSTTKDADAAKRHQLKTLWAVVEGNSRVDSYKGLTGNQKLAEGTYQIDFNRDISKCAYTATIAAGETGDISTQKPGQGGSPHSVIVRTTDNTGGNVTIDKPFHLV